MILILSLIWLIFLSIIQGWAFAQMFNWFVAGTFTTASLTILHGIGLLITIRFLVMSSIETEVKKSMEKIQRNQEESGGDYFARMGTMFAAPLLAPILLMIVGWFLHQIIF